MIFQETEFPYALSLHASPSPSIPNSLPFDNDPIGDLFEELPASQSSTQVLESPMNSSYVPSNYVALTPEQSTAISTDTPSSPLSPNSETIATESSPETSSMTSPSSSEVPHGINSPTPALSSPISSVSLDDDDIQIEAPMGKGCRHKFPPLNFMAMFKIPLI